MFQFTLPLILLMSYNEWFLRAHEMQSVYPFNGTQVAPIDAGEDRLHEASMRTPDGANLIVWVAAPLAGKPTIFYLSGNAGNLATRAARFSELINNGFGVVAPAYRGSSGSSGSPNEITLTSDAFFVFDAVHQLTGQANGPIILYGESLGTAVATKIAAARAAHAIVLEAPFTSIPDLAKAQYPDIDLDDVLTQFWNTADLIGGVDEPLFILHGTADILVPFEQGQIIFDLAGSDRKWIEPLVNVGHSGIWTDGALIALYAFLDRL